MTTKKYVLKEKRKLALQVFSTIEHNPNDQV